MEVIDDTVLDRGTRCLVYGDLYCDLFVLDVRIRDVPGPVDASIPECRVRWWCRNCMGYTGVVTAFINLNYFIPVLLSGIGIVVFFLSITQIHRYESEEWERY